MKYPIVIVPLTEEDGGGYLSYTPDLVGCMSDGETPEEAATNIQDAIAEWLDLFVERNPDVPPPAPHSADAAVAAERQHLVERLREVSAAHQAMDERVEQLARDIDDIRERIEHIEAWSRFRRLAVGPHGTTRDPNQLELAH